METKFKIGDEVVLSDKGGNYTTYDTMAELMSLTNYVHGRHAPTNERLMITHIKNHICSMGYDPVYAVQDVSGQHYLTSEDYMVLAEPAKTIKRVTYEKVTDLSNNEIAKAMIDGEVFYSEYGTTQFSWNCRNFVVNNNSTCIVSGTYYRRVEEEIDWCATLDEKHSGVTKLKGKYSGEIEINEYFTKCQAIELAYDILRATGEIE